MPHYDYSCANCKAEIEIFQKITEEPLKACPECHESTLRRKVGGAQSRFHFKGSGFYLTDYCKKGGCSECK